MKTKRILFSLCSVAVVTIVAFATYTEIHNHRQISELTRRNLEVLLNKEGEDNRFYEVPRYNLEQRFRVTKVKGNVNVSVGALLSLSEASNFKIGAEIEGTYVDCHKGYCLSTTEKQTIACAVNTEWAVCHSQCNHSTNQM